MWQTIQHFQEGFETIAGKEPTLPIEITGKRYYVFREHNLKYCKCEKGEFWTGQAEYECPRDIKEIRDQRLLLSRIYFCETSGIYICVIKTNLSEQEEHKNEYMKTILS